MNQQLNSRIQGRRTSMLRRYKLLLRLLITLPLAAMLLNWTAQPAEASLWSRIKDIYTAPEKIDDFKEKYDNVVTELELQKQELDAARDEAAETLRRWNEQQQQWVAEQQRYEEQNELLKEQLLNNNEHINTRNAELEQQNAALAERLALLEHQQQDKNALIHKIMMIVLTVLALLLAYFIAMRLIRILIWKRQNRPVDSASIR